MTKPNTQAQTVVVVGGGFAGRAALRYLWRLSSDIRPKLILVDHKPYFEFCPASLRCIVETGNLESIIAPQQLPGVHFIHGRVVMVTPTNIIVHLARPSESGGYQTNVRYDFCIWATGAEYASPIQTAMPISAQGIHPLSMRLADILHHRTMIINANQ